MVYYSDEDRARAQRARRHNQKQKALKESPEDYMDIRNDMFRDLIGGNLYKPEKIDRMPLHTDFNLPHNYLEVMKVEIEESRFKKLDKAREKLIWNTSIVAVVAFLIILYAPAAWIFIIVSSIIIMWLMYTSSRNVQGDRVGPTHTSYNAYERKLRDYEYWQRKNSIQHWNKLSGHAFEASCASLFRSIGFKAQVSAVGGDGGIDIILTNQNRKIAVQCKRYKKSVGPHVIRDLWGTMNALGYNEGCIITTTGFTKGVKAFADGKNIHLIDLSDILRAVKEPTYLAKKMG